MSRRNKKVIAIYDSDAIAYRAAAVVDKRSIEVQHIKSGRTRAFDTRTEFKNFLKAKDFPFVKEDYVITDKIEAGELSHCLSIMKNQVETINSALKADEMLMCIQGKGNFRDNLPLPSQYKGSRVGLQRPIHLREAKLYLYKNYPSFVANNFEVDDAVIFKGYEYLNKGYTPIIVGVDKDARTYSALSLYNYTLENPKIEVIPEFGALHDTGDKITGEGFLWFCFQLLNGDIADSYKPCELAGVKFGEKSSFKVLKDCKNEKEALKAVKAKYLEWYPIPFEYTAWNGQVVNTDYKGMIDLYFKAARMMTTENDKLDSVEFFSKYGVELLDFYEQHGVDPSEFMLE